ncbi:hypothetical protein CDL12_01911 [Handroanthus impetiginosus]|uniref:Dof zinc finger protein n=1 Tax=Handroanthus impetiginosus TaxID=429701 RepID=A0A2G9I6I5_9LAMI|nr:hypothetical protein CDL12_01911 [Handroanthus impetiginosus]
MDTAQWPQEIVVKPMEEIVTTNPKPSSMERKIRPQKEQALNCPRCNSTNTKFCYYNNYSLSQPRYFCKTCRRYWTEGGSLRNIPVGGGSRKNKRSSSSSLSSSSSSISTNPSSSMSSSPTVKKLPDLVGPAMNNIIPHLQNPKNIIIHQENIHQDLNLGFSSSPHDFKAINELIQVPNFENNTKDLLQNNPCSSFMTSSSGFCLPSLNFSLDHDHGSGSSNYGSFQGEQETNGKLLFPFQGLKVIGDSGHGSAERNSDQNGDHHNQNHNSSAGYWSGVIGGGS